MQLEKAYIYNIFSKVVKDEMLEGEDHVIGIPEFPDGIYYFEAYSYTGLQ